MARYQQDKVNQLDALGENVCTVIGALQREVEVTNNALNREREFFQQQVLTMKEQMLNLQTSFIRQNQMLDRMCLIQEQLSNSIATISSRQETISEMVEELRNNSNNYNNINTANGSNVIRNENNNTINVSVVLPTAIDNSNVNPAMGEQNALNNANNVPTADAIIQNQRNRRPRINAFAAIGAEPQVPPMSVLFPETWLSVLEEWNLLNLSSFVGYGHRHHFDVKQNSRYGKRLRAFTQIQKASQRRGFSLRDTAEQLDVERQFRIQQAIGNGIRNPRFSLTKHLEEIESMDPTLRRRGGNRQN